MTDPGNADFAFANLWKLRRHIFAGSLHEQRRNQNTGQEITFVPVGPRTQPDARGIPPRWNRRIIAWRLANNISPVLFRKADWHGLKRIWDSYEVESVKTLQTSDKAMHLAFDVGALAFDLVSFYFQRSVTSSHAELEGLCHTVFDLFGRVSVRIALAVRHCIQGTGPIQSTGCEGEVRELEIITDR